MFRPMPGLGDIGLKVLLFLVVWFSQWFLQVSPLTSLVLLVFVVFLMVFDILSRVQGQARSETDLSPHLLVAPSTFSNEGPAHKPTRCA